MSLQFAISITVVSKYCVSFITAFPLACIQLGGHHFITSRLWRRSQRLTQWKPTTGARFEEKPGTLATLAKPGGRQCGARPLSLLCTFTFCVCLSPQHLAEFRWLSLLTPSGEPGHVKPVSINHSAPARGGRRGVGGVEGRKEA